VYAPALVDRLNVPSVFVDVEAASEVSGLYKLIVTPLLARTCPVSSGDDDGEDGGDEEDDDEVGAGAGAGAEVVSRTVRLMGTESISVRALFPMETRAAHLISVCPACKPVTSKVNTAPSMIAFWPLLPAIATMKLPFCGSKVATAGSVPKRP